MKNTLIAIVFFFCSFNLFAQESKPDFLPYTKESNFFKAQRKMNRHFRYSLDELKKEAIGVKEKAAAAKEIEEFSEYKRWEFFWRDRVFSDGKYPSAAFLYSAFKARELESSVSKLATSSWTNISQTTSTGGYSGMGRTTCIAFHPTDTNIFYVGSPNGGLWKTTNAGLNYIPLGDQLPFVSAGSILVDPSNPNTLYVSSGDAVGWWNYNAGVYKSIDGGLTWNPTGLVWQLSAQKAIYKMEFEPGNSSIIYVASTGGLYKSTNGGSTFNLIYAGSINDIKFKPGSSSELYISVDNYWGSSEIYYSSNSATSFTKITNFNTNYNFLKLAVTPANPSVVAVYCSVNNQVYRSSNSGSTFNLKSSNAPGNGAFFISPTNATEMYCGNVDVAKSSDAGVTWSNITIWYNSPPLPEVHADLHNITYNPLTPTTIYFNNDGGLYQLNTNSNTWLELSNNLVITQFYSVANSQTNSDFVIGGTQDNGGRKRISIGNWLATNGGDAMETAVDPNNDNTIYTTYTFGKLYRSLDQWTLDVYHDITPKDNFGIDYVGDWVTPYSLNPQNSTTIFAGYTEVYKSTNRGDSWTAISNNLLAGSSGSTLQALAIAPSDSQFIYTSSGNVLYFTSNAGTTWNTTTLAGTNRITAILVHPSQPNTLWVSRAGFGSKVFKSSDGGITFQNVSGTLPNVPANCLFYEPSSANGIYVGTDLGVYYKNDSLANWVAYNNGLPAVTVTDFAIYSPANKLRIATYGRGIWETNLYSTNVGISENSTTQPISIYPNPANDFFNVLNPIKSGKTQVVVRDIQGRFIYNVDANMNAIDTKIDCKNWANGIYIVQIINENKMLSNNKILVQHL